MPVRKQIIINASAKESRVALLEDGKLAEIHVERAHEQGTAGNIYKGKVLRVLPGMQAAFVDIGLEKAGFIHASDLFSGALPTALLDEEGEIIDGEESLLEPIDPPPPPRRLPLEEKLKKGQEVLVQVSKESIGTKGPRLTSHISLPGRYLVYAPTTHRIGVSRRIGDEKERKRLRETMESLRPPEGGFIVRTACEGLSKKEIEEDTKFLLKLWGEIIKKSEGASVPALLHYDMDVILRSIRDLFTSDVQQVMIDNPKDYQQVTEFVSTFMPRLASRVKLYDQPEPIFDHFGIEAQISKALERRVWLQSGGHIVIDPTEALTAIDVNTGRYVGKNDQEETMLKTNLEAAKEIVNQLRLRNIGGLIIIDFIDMAKTANRNKVSETLREALKKDKARPHFRKITELGLVQMTRKRTRESLSQLLCHPCPHCEGRGLTRSVSTIAYEILQHVQREAFRYPQSTRITVKAYPEVVTFLYNEEGQDLDQLEKRLKKHIVIKASEGLHQEGYEVSSSS
jgi:ribonuclease G